ncbi:MAG TPA: VOC family protein [Candidatus Thermoplasmatota archaeon]|jgi:catechol 2,3-dioxygenase-like lactoylglutathione lyase family enzyme|nr:VOC family protein [Candidatus Thermoplasmatota archaeon]
MPARPGFPVGIFVQDVAKNVEYFTHILGFREVERFVAADGTVAHALVSFGRGMRASGVAIASIPALLATDYDFGEFGNVLRRGPLHGGVVLNFVVADVDAYYERIRAKGALIDEPPADQFWGERTISVRTPDGYYLAFAKRIPGFRVPAEYGRFERPRPPRARRARARR